MSGYSNCSKESAIILLYSDKSWTFCFWRRLLIASDLGNHEKKRKIQKKCPAARWSFWSFSVRLYTVTPVSKYGFRPRPTPTKKIEQGLAPGLRKDPWLLCSQPARRLSLVQYGRLRDGPKWRSRKDAIFDFLNKVSFSQKYWIFRINSMCPKNLSTSRTKPAWANGRHWIF